MFWLQWNNKGKNNNWNTNLYQMQSNNIYHFTFQSFTGIRNHLCSLHWQHATYNWNLNFKNVITFEGKVRLRWELDQNVRKNKQNTNIDDICRNDVFEIIRCWKNHNFTILLVFIFGKSCFGSSWWNWNYKGKNNNWNTNLYQIQSNNIYHFTFQAFSGIRNHLCSLYWQHATYNWNLNFKMS